ncbi:MAG: sigma 54-interacting transcriptional regulator [Gemmatimonadetes bacterium]|nr:sigma 54-interacting transcriptional regulator [Gemmatimonadota bacterium]
MSEILVSTHDLPRAGALRTAFREAGFGVELVTPDEDFERYDEALLLVVTGGLGPGVEGPGGTLEVEGDTVHRARATLGIPALAYAPAARGREPAGVMEVFPPSVRADEVALVGGRLAERVRLQAVTGIVGETDAMHEVLERVVQIAPVSSTVLVTGESGTGKELVARGLHALSPRRHKPFIAVNVAALPDTLLESELFGHEKGAFTGAIDARKGLFELADGGTIFLDEIGEMPLATQTKLLRVLEQREFLRVGGERPIHVDVRIVAATNQDLRQLVTLREFRQDLYYRLNVLHIELPPLRERRADIPRLVRRFSQEVTERLDRPFSGISDEAMEILAQHDWPGNVRELRNLVESMVVLAPGERIQPKDIPDEIRSPRRETAGLLPAPIPRGGRQGTEGLRPQLEFIFRTLVDMRVDLDDLRRDFEAWREDLPRLRGRGEVGLLPGATGGGASRAERPADRYDIVDVWPEVEPPGVEAGAEYVPSAADDVENGGLEHRPEVTGPVLEGAGAEGVVVYRPGMTMEDLEREAIASALASVDGNRRKAAELLQIGERTLYRKIKKFGLEI